MSFDGILGCMFGRYPPTLDIGYYKNLVQYVQYCTR